MSNVIPYCISSRYQIRMLAPICRKSISTSIFTEPQECSVLQIRFNFELDRPAEVISLNWRAGVVNWNWKAHIYVERTIHEQAYYEFVDEGLISRKSLYRGERLNFNIFSKAQFWDCNMEKYSNSVRLELCESSKFPQALRRFLACCPPKTCSARALFLNDNFFKA